jgi:hypothetical protein
MLRIGGSILNRRNPRMDIAAIFAGFFAGVSAICVCALVYLSKLYRKTDAERMKLWNKLLVRDGQQTLFSPVEIEGVPIPKPEIPPTNTVRSIASPFRRGQQRMRQNLQEQKTEAAGNRPPPDLKENLAASVEKFKNGNGN